jgi:hypothetical protein
MLDISRGSMLAAAILLGASQAKAEDAPGNTADFVASCASNFEACRLEVLSINNFNKLTKIGIGDGSLGRCTYPETVPSSARTRADVIRDSTTATKAILAWLTVNSAKRNPKTKQAIVQAEKALWPAECI